MRRLVHAAAALLVTLSLAGCATLPTSGPVQTSAPQQEQDDPAVFVPNGPSDGMGPEDVVRGFVQAQGAGRGYRVAREFLTAGFARSWQPDQSVLVHSAQWSVDARDEDDQVRLRVVPVGEVDETGRFSPTDRVQTKDYTLQRVRGQWRISDGPPGVVVSEGRFPSVLTPVSLWFFDPTYRHLVPDLRWFPVADGTAAGLDGTAAVSDRTAGQEVRALLGGAAPVLQGVTVPVFPSGAELAQPVRSSGGVTTVAVDLPGGRPDERTTDRMQQALAAALLRSTASLRLVVNGVAAPQAQPAQLDQPSITNPVVVSRDRFGALTAAGTVQEDGELGPKVVQLKPTAVTVSARQRLAAVQARGGQVYVVSRQRTHLVDERSGLVAPTLDQRGWTYSIPADDTAGMRVSDASGRSFDAGMDLGGSSVVSIEVSTDGTRLLVLHLTSSGPEAYVAGILRDADGRPNGLTVERYPIALDNANALGATWVGQVQVAILTGASTQGVTLQQLGGLATPLGALSNARSIVGATKASDLRALLGSGQILRLSSSNVWNLEFPAALDVDVLAVQR